MRRSAGLLLWRRVGGGLEVLLGHPGGPLYARKDDGVWSVPKGEREPDEPALAAAYREFAEELGQPAPDGDPTSLGEVRLRSGKVVEIWSLEGTLDVTEVVSSPFQMVWPPRSGRVQSFPELDRAAWFPTAQAVVKLTVSQRPFLDRLTEQQDRTRD